MRDLDWDRFEGPPPIVFPPGGRVPYHADTKAPATREDILALSMSAKELLELSQRRSKQEEANQPLGNAP